MKMVEKKSNWKEETECLDLVLFNEYPNICNKLGAFDDEPLIHGGYDEETGEYDEVFQWFAVGASESTVDYVIDRTRGAIAPIWSEAVGMYILPVCHWGTPWDGVDITVYEWDYSDER